MKLDLVRSNFSSFRVALSRDGVGFFQLLVKLDQIFHQAGVFQGRPSLVGYRAEQDQILLEIPVAG